MPDLKQTILLASYFDCSIIEDFHKGDYRLSINGHGRYTDGQSTIKIEGERYTPALLYQFLRSSPGPLSDKGRSLYRYRKIRILSCHSANDENNSFAVTLSRMIPNIRIKGYKARVVGHPAPGVVNKYFEEKNEGDIFQKKPGGFICNKYDYHYHSVTYLNGESIKEHNNGI